MKIYYICSADLSNFDAQRTHILEVVSQMHKIGEDVTLFLPQFQKDKVYHFPFKTKFISTIIKKSKLKFVEYEIWLLFYMAFRCLINRPDILYSRKGFFSLVPTIISHIFGIKTVVEVNGIVANDMKMCFGLPGIIVNMFALIEKVVYTFSDKVIVVTEGLKECLNLKYGIDKTKIEIVHNGVNTSLFLPKPASNREILHLGFVGNLAPWAGIEVLIKSIPLVTNRKKNVKYIIVGGGQLMESLKKLAETLKIDDYITFTGAVKPFQVVDYINDFDICFVPAVIERNQEIGISPLKLFEYMACGKPVIASNIKGLDIVEKYNAGRLFEAENIEELANVTIDLLENNETRKQMGIQARNVVEKHFSWKIVTEKVLMICKDTLV